MQTVDLSKNVKQQELLNEVFTSIRKRKEGKEDFNKYFFYGGAIRGGKTFCILTILTILCRMFPKSKWVVVRADMPALTTTTIPSLEKIIGTSPNWKWSRDKSNYFVKHKNGAKIIFKGENITSDPELNDFLGLECNGFFLEQIEELSQKMWYRALERSGSHYVNPMPPPFIFSSFNPTQTWIKDFIYVRHMKGELQTPFHYINASPMDNPFVTKDQWSAWENLDERSRATMIDGDWSNFDTEMRFVYTFKEDKHIRECEYRADHIAYLSFDFNRSPICCSIIQQYDDAIYVPIVIKLQNANTYELCDYILRNYPNSFYVVTGDYSGKTKGTVNLDDYHNYDIIQQKLQVSSRNMYLVPNPPLKTNRVLVNAVLEHYPCYFDPVGAKELIFDFKHVEILPDGTIKKKDRNDPAQQADALDTFRYYLNVFMQDFIRLMD